MQTDRILVAGETLVDLFPDGPGSLAEVDGFRHRAGGAPANVAVGLARLGDPPAFWTRLGGDPFGDFLADRLAAHGVPADFVVRGDALTALTVVSPTPDGDRSFSFYAAETATFAFERGRVPDAALCDCECVSLGGVALADPRGRAAMLDLAERARASGCLVSVDPNARPDVHDTEAAREGVRDLLGLADVVCASVDDLAVLGLDGGYGDPDAVAASLLDHGPDTVFLTLGGDGAVAVTDAGGERVARSQAAFDVDVVDTTGAGDAFTAGVLARYERGCGADCLTDALRWGCAAGALATTETGGMTALPDAAAVRDLLA